jgi:hypothetical protein
MYEKLRARYIKHLARQFLEPGQNNYFHGVLFVVAIVAFLALAAYLKWGFQ